MFMVHVCQNTIMMRLFTDSNMDKPKFCCGCRGCGIKFNQWQELRNHLDEKSGKKKNV